MNLRDIALIAWRFKWLVVLGVLGATVLTALSIVRVDRNGVVEYRDAEKWASYSRLFVTQEGFPWGRLDGGGNVDPNRFSSLAVLFATLIDNDSVRTRIHSERPFIRGDVEAVAVLTPDADVLPIIQIAGIAPTRAQSLELTRRATDALLAYIRGQQEANQIPGHDRVVINEIQSPSRSRLVDARALTLPIFVFLGVLSLTAALIAVLHNAFPPRPAPKAAAHVGAETRTESEIHRLPQATLSETTSGSRRT